MWVKYFYELGKIVYFHGINQGKRSSVGDLCFMNQLPYTKRRIFHLANTFPRLQSTLLLIEVGLKSEHLSRPSGN